MITITREGVGRILGFILLTLLVLGLSYLTVAFVAWDTNPGHWSVGERIGAVGAAVWLIILHRVQIVNDVASE